MKLRTLFTTQLVQSEPVCSDAVDTPRASKSAMDTMMNRLRRLRMSQEPSANDRLETGLQNFLVTKRPSTPSALESVQSKRARKSSEGQKSNLSSGSAPIDIAPRQKGKQRAAQPLQSSSNEAESHGSDLTMPTLLSSASHASTSTSPYSSELSRMSREASDQARGRHKTAKRLRSHELLRDLTQITTRKTKPSPQVQSSPKSSTVSILQQGQDARLEDGVKNRGRSHSLGAVQKLSPLIASAEFIGPTVRRIRSSQLLSQLGLSPRIPDERQASEAVASPQLGQMFSPHLKRDGLLTQVNRFLGENQLIAPLIGAVGLVRLRPHMLFNYAHWSMFQGPNASFSVQSDPSLLDVYDHSFEPFSRSLPEQLQARTRFHAEFRPRALGEQQTERVLELVPALTEVIEQTNLPSVLWALKTLIEPGQGPLLDPCEDFADVRRIETPQWRVWFGPWPQVTQELERQFSKTREAYLKQGLQSGIITPEMIPSTPVTTPS